MNIIAEAETVAEAATGTGWLKLVLPIGVVVALLIAIGIIHHKGEAAGEAKVTAKVERQHAAAVTDARVDERAATAAAAAVGSQSMAKTDAAIAALQLEEKRIHDVLDAVPPAEPGAALPPAPVGVLAASVNAGIDRANGAADAADAATRAGQTGAP